jgi:emfourin
MKLTYRRTGGIANIKIEREFESDSLPANHADTLNHLLKNKSTTKISHPDEFIHELHTGTRTLRFLDSQLSTEEIALFQFLTSLR